MVLSAEDTGRTLSYISVCCVLPSFPFKNSDMKSVLRLQKQLDISGGQKTELLYSLWVNVKTSGSAVGVNTESKSNISLGEGHSFLV